MKQTFERFGTHLLLFACASMFLLLPSVLLILLFPNETQPLGPNLRRQAWEAACRIVSADLNEPETPNYLARYQDPERQVKSLGQGRYQAKGWIYSQDDDGRPLTTEFTVIVAVNKDGVWKLVRIDRLFPLN